MNCPNKNCKNFDKSMDKITRHNQDFVNYSCGYCHCHYYGSPDNPKFYTKEEWNKWVNEDLERYRKNLTLYTE